MTTTPNSDAARRVRHFDIYSDETTRHLDSTLAYSRKVCPVARSEENDGFYLVSSYELVRAVLADPVTFSSRDGISQPPRQILPMPPINSDPPLHNDFRKLLNSFFSRAGLAPSEGAIRAVAAGLLDDLVDRGEMEFLEDFATPLTSAALCRVILALDDDRLAIEAVTKVEAIATANDAEAWRDLTSFLADLVDGNGSIDGSGQQTAQRSLLAAIGAGHVAGRPITHDEKLGILVILFLGGLDTTRAAMTWMVRHMVDDPTLEQRMRDPGWTTRALDEMLRYDTVVTAPARTVTRETELGGQRLSVGDRIVCHYYSANHDEAQFPRADELLFDRERNPHIAFGVGIHRCLGSNLARLQIKVGFEELLVRVQDIRAAHTDFDATPIPGMTRMPRSMPITFTLR